MNSWAEVHIGLVYYGGLLLFLAIGILAFFYLKPGRYLKNRQEKSAPFWSRNFIITTLIAGLLGAMSVSFKDCNGSYRFLIDHRAATLELGIDQISTACLSFTVMFGVWFLILMALKMTQVWRPNVGSFYKILSVVLIASGILGFYLIHFLKQKYVIVKALILFVLLSITGVNCNAQVKGDSVLYPPFVVYKSDSVGHFNERAIEIFKINANRTFRLDKSRSIWVQCENKKGRIKIKRAQLISITGNEMRFKPFNKNFKEITYSDSDIMYIGFTSTGRIIIASVSNIIIISTVVFVYTVVIMAAILSGSTHIGGFSGDLRHVPIVPFKKNISFYENLSGNRKWGVRIVESKQSN